MPDAVVVGSGPNGLVAANHLADAGLSVVVLEAEPAPGGAVRTEELTLPGFSHDVFSAFYPLAAVSPALGALDLGSFGLRWRDAPVALAHPLPDGGCVELSTDRDRTAASLDALSGGDGEAWTEMLAEWDAVAPAVLACIFRPFPPLAPLARLCARLGPVGIARLARHALLPARTMAEERFAGAGARLLLAGCAAHTDLAPEAAGGGLFGWLLCCLAQRVGFPVPEGGAGALTGALVARLRARGGEVICGAEVVEVVVRSRRAVAVRIAGGDLIDAGRAVLADVPAPALFGGLVAAEHLPDAFVRDVARFGWDPGTVKVDWALSGPVPFGAEGARQAGVVHLADDLDNLTAAAAELAMGLLPSRPFLVLGQQSLMDPSRAPAGAATAWAYTRVPRRPRGDAVGRIAQLGDDRWLEPFVERIESQVERRAPGFRERILARHVASPSGLERRDRNLVGGAIGGGTSQPYQQLLLRPVPGMGRCETPIAGLYLVSASAHPGGGVHGAAGANAARAVLLAMARTRAVVLGRGARRPRWPDGPAVLRRCEPRRRGA